MTLLLCYTPTLVYDVCSNFVLYLGGHISDITDWTTVVLQMDVKITSCNTVMEATDRTVCTASGKLSSLMLDLFLHFYCSQCQISIYTAEPLTR